MEKLKSIKLLQVYNEVLQVVDQLDDTFLNILKTSEGDVPANIKRRMERIENKEHVVLVAGALTFYHHSKFFFLTQFDCDRSRDHYNAQIKQQLNSLSNNDGDGHETVTYEVALLQTLSHLLPQFQFAKCWQFFSGVEFQKAVSKFRKRKSKSVSCVHARPPQNVKISILTS